MSRPVVPAGVSPLDCGKLCGKPGWLPPAATSSRDPAKQRGRNVTYYLLLSFILDYGISLAPGLEMIGAGPHSARAIMTIRGFVAELLQLAKAKGEAADDRTEDPRISVWKESSEQDNELVMKGRKMVARAANPDEAYEALSRAWNLAQNVADNEVEAVNGKYGGFPVLEVQIGTLRRKPWFIYVSAANGKSCLLLISEAINRDQARGRALVWIEKCQNRHQHGDPVFISLDGTLLEPPRHVGGANK
jgi:hypothetical protein